MNDYVGLEFIVPSNAPQMTSLSYLRTLATPYEKLCKILPFLEASPNLTHVDLRLVHLEFDDPPPSRTTSLSLSKLTSLTFEIYNTSLSPLLSWISCPVLSSLSLSIIPGQEFPQIPEDLVGINDFLNNRSQAHETLKELSIVYNNERGVPPYRRSEREDRGSLYSGVAAARTHNFVEIRWDSLLRQLYGCSGLQGWRRSWFRRTPLISVRPSPILRCLQMKEASQRRPS